MSTFETPNKPNFKRRSKFGPTTAIFAVLLAFASSTSAKSHKHKGEVDVPEVNEMLLQAKSLLSQGRRKDAVDLLDRGRTMTSSKRQLADLMTKRTLFIEQFLTSDSFQHFAEAKGLAEALRPEECLRELDGVTAGDRDNVLVLRLKAGCQLDSKAYDQAQKAYQAILQWLPGDMQASYGAIEIAIHEKQYIAGLKLIDTVKPKNSADIEREALLRARLYELNGDQSRAEEVLRRDHETYLDHVEVLYDLGMLYGRAEGRDWPARKMLSLFVTRCKRMSDSELKARHFDTLLPQAQAALLALDKKLGV